MNFEGFMTHINEIPIINSPEVFGLHPNAEITYFTNGAKLLWSNLISMQSSDGGGDVGINKEEYVFKIACDI
jgi:dynein heavy chain